MPQIPLDWFSDDEIFAWKRHHETRLILELLRNYLIQKKRNPNIVILDTPQAQGFLLNRPSLSMSLVFWQKLLFYWVDFIKSDGYVLQNREFKTSSEQNIYFMYLKPSIRRISDALISQKYGNIIIELKEKNAKAVSLKIQINQYSDRRYADPIEISELYNMITC